MIKSGSKPSRSPRPTASNPIVGKLKDVESDVVIDIGRVEINNVLDALLRNFVEHSLDQLPVRVDNREAFAIGDVLDDHVVHERAFTSAGLPHHIHMLSPVNALDAK